MHSRSPAAAGLAVLAALATAPAAVADKPDRVTAEVTDGILVVTGTDGDDAIGLEARGRTLRVVVPGRDHRFALAEVLEARIAPGPGADTVTLTGSDDADFPEALGFGGALAVVGLPVFAQVEGAEFEDAVVIDGAGGDDQIGASSIPAGGARLTLAGGAGDDDLRGSRGHDVLRGGPGADAVVGGQGADDARLGAGDDLFRWDPGEGSDTVAGQDGRDSLTVVGSSASERFDVTAVGEDVRLTRDVGETAMALSGLERISGFAQAGADVVAIGDLSGTGVTGTDWGLGALDAAPDLISLAGTARDDALTVSGGVQNPAGTSTSAEVRGLPATVLVTALQHDDTLALEGGGGQDTLDDSGLIPGGFALSFVP